MPKKKDTKPPSAMPSRVVSAIPDLSADQRRDVRAKNVEEILAHPKLIHGQLTDHLVETALGNNPDAAPSQVNQALTVVTSAMYGKDPGSEWEKPQQANIEVVINGSRFDPSSMTYLPDTAEDKENQLAAIERLKAMKPEKEYPDES